MSKPEWGVKRLCHECDILFYDMRRQPIKCPKCGAIFKGQDAKKGETQTFEKVRKQNVELNLSADQQKQDLILEEDEHDGIFSEDPCNDRGLGLLFRSEQEEA